MAVGLGDMWQVTPNSQHPTTIFFLFSATIRKHQDIQCLPYARFSKHRPSEPMLSISWNVRLSVRLSVRVSVCSLLKYCLNVFLPPLPEVGCPKYLEIRILGEKYWQEVVSDLNIFAQNGLKLPQQKKSILQIVFFICSLLRYCLNIFLPPLCKVRCTTFLEIRNPWGKVLEIRGLRFEHFYSKMV